LPPNIWVAAFKRLSMSAMTFSLCVFMSKKRKRSVAKFMPEKIRLNQTKPLLSQSRNKTKAV
jgi:hypothetical protein